MSTARVSAGDTALEPTSEIQAAVRRRYGQLFYRGAVLLVGIALALSLLRPSLSAAVVGIYLTVLAAVVLVQRTKSPDSFRASVIVAGLWFLGLVETFTAPSSNIGVLYLFFAFVVAVLLLSFRAGWILAAVNLLALSLAALLRSGGSPFAISSATAAGGAEEGLASTALLGLLSICTLLGLRALDGEFRQWQRRAATAAQELERQRHNISSTSEQQSRLLRLIAEVGRSMVGLVDDQRIAQRATEAIRNAIATQGAAVYALDPTGTWLELKASAADQPEGRQEEFPPRVDAQGQSIIARALRQREPTFRDLAEPRLAGAGETGPSLRFTEAAVPMFVADRATGILVLRSSTADPFSPESLSLVQDLANTVAGQIAGVQGQARGPAAPTDSRGPASTGERPDGTHSMRSTRRLSISAGEGLIPPGLPSIDVPLALRDQILGRITMAADKELDPDERSMIEAIAAQAALALENARLIDDVRENARRSELLAEVSGRVRETLDIQQIMESAGRELVRSLGLREAELWLYPPAGEQLAGSSSADATVERTASADR